MKTRAEDCTQISVGAVVKAYDFQHRQDCYIVGKILECDVFFQGCDRYRIQGISKHFPEEDIVGQGIVFPDRITPPKEFFPPMNGTPNFFGGFTNFVQPHEIEAL